MVDDTPKKKLLMLAYCCHPAGTMEQRNGWHRAVLAAQSGFSVTVLYCPSITDLDNSLLVSRLPDDLRRLVQFVPVPLSRSHKLWLDYEPTFYAAYKRWHRLAFQQAKTLHSQNPFNLTHTVTLCGFREPGYLWRLGIPHIWGPLGGTHVFPVQFLSLLGWKDRLRESMRTCLNGLQLCGTPRVWQASKKSAFVIAATSAAQKTFSKSFGVPILTELEAGIEFVREQSRPERDPKEPLKILWAGRLRGWKALPILLRALARLPKDQAFSLRVLGDGGCQKEWQQLAANLGIALSIEWVPWPTYTETLPHYDWADVFAFTSLRDTSGTGLLEALAAGCPIISVNHQGAADIVDETCGMLIPVVDPERTVQGFTDSLRQLHQAPELWKRLSEGALARAQMYRWDARLGWTKALYESALSDGCQNIARLASPERGPELKDSELTTRNVPL
ncbi:MAG: glycosyltransferase [Pirellula sp.]|jgi:glycosyltransferase involved in cell wall biosynthesis|nr:glycosyltransferase [Pirellula sp.]